ncbi:MAG: hypothetical protein ACXW2P_03500 [Thermoanaerobaculia bacterium]
MLRSILTGTVIVGILEIGEVIAFYALRGVQPIRILQGVAAGLDGRESFRGGWETALIGLAIHFTIALVVVTIYHLAAAKAPFLSSQPYIYGALYGVAVFAVMSYLVVPMSAAGPPNRSWPIIANLLFVHVFCVGIPAALTARFSGGTDL